MAEILDAVVIGMGHQGLIAANLLAQQGLSVAVIDVPQYVPGGGAYDLFADGFRTGPCAHTPVPVDQDLSEKLGLEERGFTMKPEQTCSFAPVSMQTGDYIFANASRASTQREIAKFSKRDAETFMRVSDEVYALAQTLEKVAGTLPAYDMAGWKDLWGVFETGRLLAEGAESAQLMFARLMNSPLEKIVTEMFEHQAVQAYVCAQATMASMTVPTRKGSAAALIQYMLGLGGARPFRGDWQPLRGSLHHYLKALTQGALDRDVIFLPGQVVEGFEIQNGRIEKILMSDGEPLVAGMVIADMNPVVLCDQLIGAAHIPPEIQSRLAPLRQGTQFVRLKAALSDMPKFTSLSGFGDEAFLNGEILIAPSVDYIATARADTKADGGSHKPMMSMVIPSLQSDELAPAGKHVVSIVAQYFEPTLPNDADNWGAVAESVYRAVEDVAPGFTKLVESTAVYMGDNLARSIGPINRETLGGGHPLTQLFGSLFGHHGLSTHLPIENLYLCGYGAEASASPHVNKGGETAAHMISQKAA